MAKDLNISMPILGGLASNNGLLFCRFIYPEVES